MVRQKRKNAFAQKEKKMAKKKKNSNYVTEKTIAAKEAKLAAERKAKIKKIVKAVTVSVLSVAIIVGIIFAIGIPFGMLDYKPEATEHVAISIEGYNETIHVELYGNDAKETVAQFKKLVDEKYFNGKAFLSLSDNLLYFGNEKADFGENGIKDEFNEIAMRKGIIALSKGEGENSGKEQFFIVTKNSTDLNGKYTAFAKITGGMSVIEDIIENAELDENGKITNSPKISSISSHASH